MYEHSVDITPDEEEIKRDIETQLNNILLDCMHNKNSANKIYRFISPKPYPVYTFPFNVAAAREERIRQEKLAAEKAAAEAARLAKSAQSETE